MKYAQEIKENASQNFPINQVHQEDWNGIFW
jgi:hypothetical protein